MKSNSVLSKFILSSFCAVPLLACGGSSDPNAMKVPNAANGVSAFPERPREDVGTDAQALASCPSGYNVVTGTDAGEDLMGTDGNDCILGRGGDDRIYAGAGNDLVYGETGNDQIWGEDGNDSLMGGAGNDTIGGGAGDDQINGGADDDWLYGEDGNDVVAGNTGRDRILGGEGKNVLYGHEGNDNIQGGTQRDRIFGGPGRNWITTNGGNDLVRTEQDCDVVDGTAGACTTTTNCMLVYTDANGGLTQMLFTGVVDSGTGMIDIKSVDLAAYNDLLGPALPFLVSTTDLYGVGSAPPRISLDGNFTDFFAGTSDFYDGILMTTLFGGNTLSTGYEYGWLLEEIDTSRMNIQCF